MSYLVDRGHEYVVDQPTSAEWSKWIGVLALSGKGLLNDTSSLMKANRHTLLND